MRTKNSINWTSKESIENLVLAMSTSNTPMTGVNLAKSLSEIYGKDINSGQFKNGIDLLQSILGEGEVKVGSKYMIKDLVRANRLISQYFDKNEGTGYGKEKSLLAVSKRQLREFKKLYTFYNILSPFKSKGLIARDVYDKYSAATGVKNVNAKYINEEVYELIHKYGLKGFYKTPKGNTFMYHFYDDKTEMFLKNKIKELSRLINPEEDNLSNEPISIEDKIAKNDVKVSDSLDKLFKEELIKVLYLNNSKGMSSEELSKEMFLRLGGRQLRKSEMDNYLRNLASELDPEIYRMGFDNYKILDYSRAIYTVAPHKAYITFIIKVPSNVSVKSTLNGVQFIKYEKVDEDEKYSIYEITAKNSTALPIGLLKLILGYDVIGNDSITIDRCNKSVILTKEVRDKVESLVRNLIGSERDVL